MSICGCTAWCITDKGNRRIHLYSALQSPGFIYSLTLMEIHYRIQQFMPRVLPEGLTELIEDGPHPSQESTLNPWSRYPYDLIPIGRIPFDQARPLGKYLRQLTGKTLFWQSDQMKRDLGTCDPAYRDYLADEIQQFSQILILGEVTMYIRTSPNLHENWRHLRNVLRPKEAR